LCGYPKNYHKVTECQCGKFGVVTEAGNKEFYISSIRYDGFRIYTSTDNNLWLQMNHSYASYTKLQLGATIDLADIPKLVMLM
jgi:hypothetical protein